MDLMRGGGGRIFSRYSLPDTATQAYFSLACEAVALFLGGLLRLLKNTGGNDAEKNGEGRGKGKNKAPAIMHNKNEFPVQILNGKY